MWQGIAFWAPGTVNSNLGSATVSGHIMYPFWNLDSFRTTSLAYLPGLLWEIIYKNSSVKEFAKWCVKLKLGQHAEYFYPIQLTNKYEFAISWKVLNNYLINMTQQPSKLAWSHRPETWNKLNWNLTEIGPWAKWLLEIWSLTHKTRTTLCTF